MLSRRAVAFAPGRVNLIGEHTDYNDGLCLPFTIARGVTVRAQTIAGDRTAVHTRALAERDWFLTESPERAGGWRAFARGVVAELCAAGHEIPSTRLEITSDLPVAAGLSSSAALEVALALALLALTGERQPDRSQLARLCSRVENEWVGSRTGPLDQLASLFGERDAALLIDCRSLERQPVPLALDGWTIATVATGTDRQLALSGYNERTAECRRAAELLGLPSLRTATRDDLARLDEPLRRRARYVVEENDRVRAAAGVLRSGDLDELGELLDACHAGLRDDFEVSVPAVEAAIARVRAAGARGARMMGGGFGGSVLALFPPGATLPADSTEACCGPAATVLSDSGSER